MKRGQRVFCARVVGDEVKVGSAEVQRDDCFVIALNRRMPGADGRCESVRDLHATRTAALEALAERLEQEAKAEREKASEFITRVERCLINAQRARKMAEGR